MIAILKKYLISISLSAVILYLCFMSVESLPESPMTNFDKIVHFLMFLGLSGVVFFENTGYLRKPTSLQRIVFGSFLFPTLFSGIIELMQEYLSPNRTGDWMDFLFDAIGTFIGLVICLKINQILSLKNKREGE